MASPELSTIPPVGGDHTAWRESIGGPLIRRPAELVELAELVYRGVFGFGLLVASIATLYATLLTMLQPAGERAVGVVVCSVLLAGQLLATQQRKRLYSQFRRRPWLLLLPGLAIGGGAWATGAHNEQLFYVLTILLGVLGVAVPLRIVAFASLIAAAGMAAPHISDGSWAIGASVAAGIVPSLFWLILEQLARFMLGLHQSHQSPRSQHRPKRVRAERQSSPTAQPAASSAPAPYDETREIGRGTALVSRETELTARQLEVLLLCAEGLKHDQIGACLEIGAVQVGRHLRCGCERAGVATHPELVAWAICRGLIPPPQSE